MTRTEKIILGLLVIVLILVAFVAFGKGRIYKDNSGQTVIGPVKCNPVDPGYDINGVLNPICGTPKCDPTRPGFNMDGFLDPDCGGAGRKRR